MNPTPEPSTVPPSGPADDENLGWRKVAWIVLAAIVGAPPVARVGFATPAYARDDFEWPWFTRHPGVLMVTVVLAGSLAGIGLWRGWYKRNSALSGWTIRAATVLGVAVFAVLGIHRMNRKAIDMEVLWHLPQMSAAADQYFLGYGGSSVAAANLIGATNYVKALNTVAHESYPAYYTQGLTITVTGVAGPRAITYAP